MSQRQLGEMDKFIEKLQFQAEPAKKWEIWTDPITSTTEIGSII